LVKSILLEGLLWHDNILSTGVTGGTVGVENLFSGTGISGESGGYGNSSCYGGSGSSGLNGLLYI